MAGLGSGIVVGRLKGCIEEGKAVSGARLGLLSILVGMSEEILLSMETIAVFYIIGKALISDLSLPILLDLRSIIKNLRGLRIRGKIFFCIALSSLQILLLSSC
jgi:hypothetical protein